MENGLSGRVPLPDAMIIDLDLGLESGFELLRFWHATAQLKAIPVIIWTVSSREREICQIFGVQAFASKQGGAQSLAEALGTIILGGAGEPARPPNAFRALNCRLQAKSLILDASRRQERLESGFCHTLWRKIGDASG